jgi:signal transduction histidine kinase
MRQATHALRRRRSRLRASQPSDPSARLFARIGYRLTGLYTGVLAAILLLAGLLLYGSMQQVLLSPISDSLQAYVQNPASTWQQFGVPPHDCVAPEQGAESAPYFLACYDALGNYLGGDRLANAAPGFTSTALARAALLSPVGNATDTADGGGGIGAIRRLAVVVRDGRDGHALGVVQVGIDIAGQLHALDVLLVLLLLVGALTLLGAGLGGIFLSRRALEPARLALARQQTFIADASHELRTPLTLLRADAEVLLRGRDRLDLQDALLLDDIVVEVEQMGALAGDLLTLARLDHGAYHLEQEVVDLGDVAESVARRAEALTAERQIRLVVSREEGAGKGPLVIGDPVKLGEAALILLDNGIKYNRPGGMVTMRVARQGPQALLEVRDTGIGIPAEHLAHLGERFYRVDKARSRQMGGAGLGLSIARGIAAAHRGTLEVTSISEQGTIATLRLPAVASSSGA